MIPPPVVRAGLVAALTMVLVEMLFEGAAGAGFWSPVVFLAALVVRDLQSLATPVPYMTDPVILGLIIHVLGSVLLAWVFGEHVAPRLPTEGARVLGGIVFGASVFAVSSIALLPLLDPAMFKLNALVFAASHLVWGATLGVMLSPTLVRQLLGR